MYSPPPPQPALTGIRVHSAVWSQLPGASISLAYAEGLNNRLDRPRLYKDIEAHYADTRYNWPHENAQSDPHIAAWRATMRNSLQLSSQSYPSSLEALVRRVLKHGVPPSINPLVDFYNSVSVRHLVPVGGWDIDGLADGTVFLRHTREHDTFRALGGSDRVTVNPGEVAYADTEEVITRHLVWRQSEKAKITPETTRILLVSEILPEPELDKAAAVCASFSAGLLTYFDVKAITAVLDSRNDHWCWRF